MGTLVRDGTVASVGVQNCVGRTRKQFFKRCRVDEDFKRTNYSFTIGGQTEQSVNDPERMLNVALTVYMILERGDMNGDFETEEYNSSTRVVCCVRVDVGLNARRNKSRG